MRLARLALLLILVNAGFFAWSQGWLDGLAFLRAQPEREPQRLTRQFQPLLLRAVSPGAASAPAGANPATATPAPAARPPPILKKSRRETF